MAICQRIGPELTALHVLPRLKELFDELAFSQESSNGSGSLSRSLKVPKPKVDGESQIESRMDLVWVLVKVHYICLEAQFSKVLMYSILKSWPEVITNSCKPLVYVYFGWMFAGCFFILLLHLFLG